MSTGLVKLIAEANACERDAMQGTSWRVIWYDDGRNQIESEEFARETLARSTMARVSEEHRGHAVRLYPMRQTDEAAAAGFPHDGEDPVKTRASE